jgi:hypothetical protein
MEVRALDIQQDEVVNGAYGTLHARVSVFIAMFMVVIDRWLIVLA